MAQTNVQAFSGDVEISSNLAVDTNTLFVDSVANRVGIGTTNPSDSLHVMGAISTQNGGDPAVTPQVLFRSGANNTNSWEMKANISDSVAGDFTIDRLDAATKEKFVIKNNGNVGIGTNNPTYPFQVDGTIKLSTVTNDASGSEFNIDGTVGHIRRRIGSNGLSYTSYDDHQFFTKATGGTAEEGTVRVVFSHGGPGNTARVGIGTTPAAELHMFNNYGVGGSANDYPKILLQHYTAAGSPAWGDRTGEIVFSYDPWDGWRGAGIYGYRNSYASTRTTYMYFYNNNGSARFYIMPSGQSVAASNMSWSNQTGWDVNISLQAPNAVYYQARSRGWNTYSSRSLKENFEPVLDSLDKVKRLDGVYYTWKQGQGDNVLPSTIDDYDQTHTIKQQKYIGFIADEIAEVLPWVCTFDENGVANGLDYGAITPVLVNAIKELDEKIGKSEASSDDRLKDNEVYVRNATETLMKLKPQIYDKKESLTSNIYHHEAGLIAQDIWYDAPELRFAVKPGLLSEIPLEAPVRSDDPREDPDYSTWGPNPASVDYNYLIPYTIKSIQEIVTDLPRQKTQVIGITSSNLNDTRGLVVVSDTNDFQKGTPKLSLSANSYDKKCFGVVSNSNTYSIDNEILIDTTGVGYVWVINHSNIESGDYLTTSNVSGYAMKQNDDLLHNYTLAKSTMDCDFVPVQKSIKRVRQELQDVTRYIKTKLYEITKEQYDSMDEMYRTSREYSYYKKSDYVKVSETGGYDKMEYYKLVYTEAIDETTVQKQVCSTISIDEWNSLTSNVQNDYSPYYSNLATTEVSLEDYTTLNEMERSKCVFTTRTIYSYKIREESKDPLPGYEPEVHQEYVNVLDENGQLQWEDTQQTEASYGIRYLNANGNITDESNHVYKAALIACTYN